MDRPTHTEAASEEELQAALGVLRAQRVAIFVVAYNAEAHIADTLRRIPDEIATELAGIFVIDDESGDATAERARELQRELPQLEVFSTPFNQGYGGNQKIGYQYAIHRGFDVVVLLHGDGQYAPESLPRLLAPFADTQVAAVFGSRMIVEGAARLGGMPFYKRLGNRVLTAVENGLMGADLSEWHSGYRAYRVAVLEGLPFQYNTSDFHFDTQIIVQLLARGERIVEVPIPTYYGDEICHVNGLQYAARCLATIVHYRVTRVSLLYHPRYELDDPAQVYRFKQAPNTVHQQVVGERYGADELIVDLGAGAGGVADRLREQHADAWTVDARELGTATAGADPRRRHVVADLDQPFAEALRAQLGRAADTVLALDVLEHLNEPEAGVRQIRALLRPGGRLLASTGNAAFFVVRFMLLFGQLNYGKRGILDRTHSRLFTRRTFRELLELEGLRVERVRAFGPPIRDMIGDSWFWSMLDRCAGWLARAWPTLFAYQLLFEARRGDVLEDLVARTVGFEMTPQPRPEPASTEVRDASPSKPLTPR